VGGLCCAIDDLEPARLVLDLDAILVDLSMDSFSFHLPSPVTDMYCHSQTKSQRIPSVHCHFAPLADPGGFSAQELARLLPDSRLDVRVPTGTRSATARSTRAMGQPQVSAGHEATVGPSRVAMPAGSTGAFPAADLVTPYFSAR
jgi:hypothetical protein